MLFRFTCKRYRSIETDAPAVITRVQSDFLTRHAAECDRCRAFSEGGRALRNALAETYVEPLRVSPDFTENVVRGVRAFRRESYRTSYRPVLVGAMAAFVALGAILQLVGEQPQSPSTDGTAEATMRGASPLKSTKPGDMNLFDSPSKLVRDPRPYDV